MQYADSDGYLSTPDGLTIGERMVKQTVEMTPQAHMHLAAEAMSRQGESSPVATNHLLMALVKLSRV